MCNSDHVGFDCSVISDWKYKDTFQQNHRLLHAMSIEFEALEAAMTKKCIEIKYNRSLFEHVYVPIHATLNKKKTLKI